MIKIHRKRVDLCSAGWAFANIMCILVAVASAVGGNFILIGMPGGAKSTTATAASSDPNQVRASGYGPDSVTEHWGRVPFGNNSGIIDAVGFCHNQRQRILLSEDYIVTDSQNATLAAENANKVIESKGNLYTFLDIGDAIEHNPDNIAFVLVQPCDARLAECTIDGLRILNKTFSAVNPNFIILYSHCEEPDCATCKANHANDTAIFEHDFGLRPVGFIFSEETCPDRDHKNPCLDKDKLIASFNHFATILTPRHLALNIDEWRKHARESNYDAISFDLKLSYCNSVRSEVYAVDQQIQTETNQINTWTAQITNTQNSPLPGFSPLEAHCAASNRQLCKVQRSKKGWYRWQYRTRTWTEDDHQCWHRQDVAYQSCVNNYNALKNQFDHNQRLARQAAIQTLNNHISGARQSIQAKETQIAQKRLQMASC